jgi:hypothetical protein
LVTGIEAEALVDADDVTDTGVDIAAAVDVIVVGAVAVVVVVVVVTAASHTSPE